MTEVARNLLDLNEKPDGYYSGKRPDMLPYIPADCRRTLEIGCAEGNFSHRIKQDLNVETWGIELNDAAAKRAAHKMDRVIEGGAEVALKELPDQHFDCIICNDVLEHIYDPYSLLEDMKPKLTESGVIVCSIPNIRYYKTLYQIVFQRQWRYEDSGVLDKTHIRFFTLASIRDLFDDLGFTVLKLEGLRPTRKVKIRLLAWLTFGWLGDIQSCEYACVVKPEGLAQGKQSS